MMAPLPYYCIHCGHEEPQVYKTYAEGNLIKLLQCTKCNQLVDPYCEYDTTLLSINVILQNKKAYRHILLNTWFENFWKLAIVFLFCESYCSWCFQKGTESKANYADFYELETNFYRALLRTVFGTAVFDGLVLLISWLSFKTVWKDPPTSFSMLTLWKGLCLCRYAVLFELVPLIWSYTNARPRILIVFGIFLLSNLQSYEVITGVRRHSSLLVLTLASLLRFYCVSLYDHWLPI